MLHRGKRITAGLLILVLVLSLFPGRAQMSWARTVKGETVRETEENVPAGKEILEEDKDFEEENQSETGEDKKNGGNAKNGGDEGNSGNAEDSGSTENSGSPENDGSPENNGSPENDGSPGNDGNSDGDEMLEDGERPEEEGAREEEGTPEEEGGSPEEDEAPEVGENPEDGEALEVRIPVTVEVTVVEKEYDGTAAAFGSVTAVSVPEEAADRDFPEVTEQDVAVYGMIYSSPNVCEAGEVSYTLDWSEEARENGELTEIYELPQGEQTAEARIRPREVTVRTLTPAETEKVYDASPEFAFAAAVVLTETHEGDAGTLPEEAAALLLTGTGELVRTDGTGARRVCADAGTYSEAVLRESDLGLAGEKDGREVKQTNFRFRESEEDASYPLSSPFTVTPAGIFLTVEDCGCSYTEVPEQARDLNAGIGFRAENPDLEEEAAEVMSGVTAFPDPVLTGGEILGPGLDVGTYGLGLEGLTDPESRLAVASDHEKAGCYRWRAGEPGSLTVTRDESRYSLSDLSAEGSVFVRGGTLYVKTGASFLIRQNTGLSDVLYDSVWIGTEGDDGVVTAEVNLTETVRIGDLAEADERETRTCYLAKTDKDGTPKNFSRGFAVTFCHDASAPTIRFSVGESASPLDQFVEKITFGRISRKSVTVDLTAEDADSGLAEADGSGFAGAAGLQVGLYQGGRTAVEKLEEAAADGVIGPEELEALEISWQSPEPVFDGSGKAVAAEVVRVSEGSYAVVFARVTDAVGNTRLYGSSGILVDVASPEQPTISYGPANRSGSGVYGGDVEVTVTAGESPDPDGAASGLQSVTVTICKDGKAVSGYTEVELFEDELADAVREGTVTRSDLQSASRMQFTQTFTIPAETFNSNDVQVEVCVRDQAGNETRAVGKTIQIDVTPPTIEVSYDNNSAQNTRYFKKPRTADLVYTERNFDPKAAVFDLTVENAVYRGIDLEELASVEGISVGTVRDSQAGRDRTARTDERTCRVKITFAGDNDYTIVPHCTDEAGQSAAAAVYASSTAEGTQTRFIIDTTAPVIQVRYFGEDGAAVTPGRSRKNGVYISGTVQAELTVTEHNFSVSGRRFADGQMVCRVSAADASGNTVKGAEDGCRADKRSGWTQNLDVWTSPRLAFTRDGNYQAGYTYTDLAGNSVKWKSDYFTVDQTAPTGTVTVGSLGTWAKWLRRISFGLFSSEKQTVSITADDATSSVRQIRYLLSSEEMSRASLAAASGWKRYRSAFSVSADRQLIVYGKIVDRAGNVMFLRSDGVVLDAAAPGPVITITVPDGEHGIYRDDVPFTVRVTDPTEGGTCSGLKSVSYEILCDGKVTQSGDLSAALRRAGSRVPVLTENLRVDAQKNNSNRVAIRVTAADQAGNEAAVEKDLKIDITEPVLAVTYDQAEAGEGSFYREARTATVTVTERNFDAAGVRFSITNTGGTQPSVSGWSHSGSSDSDSAVHTCTVTFPDDGDYTFTLEATDLAGNRGRCEQTDRFTVDRTAPVITVTYDNSEVTGGRYYREGRTAAVTIREHNFRASDVTAVLTASRDGQEMPAPVLSSFRDSGDLHTATISFTEDGDYTFAISCTDPAGNASAVYGTDRFCVDTAGPVIDIRRVGKSNTGAVEPLVEVTDPNYDRDQITLTLTGINHGETEVVWTSSDVPQGEQFVLSDLAHTAAMDDIYTLKVEAADRAGNLSAKSCTFSVNRFGSVYVCDETAERLLDQYYTNRPIDFVVTEINPDSLTRSWITCTRDGEMRTLTEGEDYTVEKTEREGEWKVYRYTIDRGNFSEDGYYLLTLYSEDRAGGISGSPGRSRTLAFVVDQTDPTIAVYDIGDGERYREESREIRIDVSDNTALESVVLRIRDEDGNLRTEAAFDREEWEEGEGMLTYTLKEDPGWQTLQVTAADAAGNTRTSEAVRVWICASRWIQSLCRPLPVVPGILLPAGTAVGICWVYRRRKRAQAVKHRSPRDADSGY